MSTRKIKDAVDHGTKELIYFKGHAKATFMSDGSTVEDAINNIESKIDLSDYVKSEELEEYAKIEDIPSLEGYAKSDDIPSLEGYAKEEDIPSLYGYATQQWVNEQEFAHQDDLLNMSFNDIQDSPITENNDGEVNIVDENGNIALKVNNEGLYVKDVIAGEHILSNKMNHSEFKTINGNSILGEGDIVISGGNVSWEDIQNKPTIPSAVTESTVSGWGFTKNTGTVNSVKINGSTKSPSNGVVDLGTVITAHQTLKTINGQSIVGSGDITISGGSSDANIQAVDTGDVIDDVNVDYATKTYVDGLVGDINSVLESIINS